MKLMILERTLQYCINMLKIKNNANNIGIFVVHNKKKNKCIKFNDLFYISKLKRLMINGLYIHGICLI